MNNILLDGIDIICENDIDANNIISPRKKEIIGLLERYIKEIEKFNKTYGLVGAKNRDELVIKHILDSLAPLGIIARLKNKQNQTCLEKESFKIADAGSGAGLPGIPLAIVLPECNFTLIERMGRRAGFLFSTTAILNLSNIDIQEKELQNIKSDLFDLVTFRAFTPLEPKILKTLFKVCKNTGIIAAYKGQYKKIKEEITLVEKQCASKEIIPYSVPFLEEERHLVVLTIY